MFSQVGISYKKQETRIQEEYNENTVGIRSEHLRFGIFFNPCQQFDNDNLEDNIDSDNNERDWAVNGGSNDSNT